MSLKKLYVLALCLFSIMLVSDARSQEGGNKYAGEFLAIGVGGRPLGMGGAYVALVNDVTSGYWNPSLLSQINYPQFSLMHDERFGNLVNYDYGAVGFPFGKDASLGLSVIRMGIDDIPDTRNAYVNGRIDPNLVTRFSTTDYAFYLTYAKKHDENFSYGANLKIIRRNIAEESAWGLGLDLGVSYNINNKIFFGANLQDITTTYLSWSTGKKEVITPTAKIGSAYKIPLFDGTLTPAMDFDVRFENRRESANANLGPVSFDMHAGIEYTFKDMFSIRTGYNDIGNLTLGAGVKLPKLNIDYSFAKFDGDADLGNTHRISLIFTLEEEKFQRKLEK
ncbi:MAG: hypothetical protein UZ04_CHB001001587 [Chlorobi bacterium OLB4]|jgi:hypothetical protein|nr:MAG: hypothetical protein EDM69_09010 [Chlorobiota bacterium]KXK03187.1 MAG: hypothetical protein UZ04_CHB001001587 [Chlorobi bacterium OLB4]MBV6399645.1 hypothetical protein [Ignavibacteria bacterium]MCE7953801.1 hypothetical protein [Chlorobi bacterium CHB7]OQY76848.1 MAG: hypothetical protein B6D43_09515 [Ignavibacteriales bacterium UTCHB1]RIK48284.1 MAG: hypothetical protein DCC60_07985 [Ignavibacteriota bacterium]